MSEHLQKMAGAGFGQFQVHQMFNRGAPKEFLESFLGASFVAAIDELRHIRPGPFAELWILRVKVSFREFAAQCRSCCASARFFVPKLSRAPVLLFWA